MPLDDYRSQVGRADMTLGLLEHCADRYEVSRTAAAIKWLDFTRECAVLVTAVNGFVLWCWRSKEAKRRRIFFSRGMALPQDSCAANPGILLGDQGVTLAPSVWPVPSEAREMAIFADRYEMTISLIVFGDDEARYRAMEDEPVEDVYDRSRPRR